MKRLPFLAAGCIFLAACAGKTPPPPASPAASTAPVAGAQPKPAKKKQASIFSWLSPKYWKEQSKKKNPPQAVTPVLIGTIRMVNAENRFVLIDAVNYQGVKPGDLLVCIADQKETAHLRMGNQMRPPFFIADITGGGNPEPGTRVFKP